jgi:hypothetical protein
MFVVPILCMRFGKPAESAEAAALLSAQVS